MTKTTMSRSPQPPARQLRLLANFAPPAAVVFGLTTAWLIATTLADFRQLFTTTGDLGGPGPVAAVVFLLLSAAAALVTGLITYRLGVEVPRTLRSWTGALDERTRVLRDR